MASRQRRNRRSKSQIYLVIIVEVAGQKEAGMRTVRDGGRGLECAVAMARKDDRACGSRCNHVRICVPVEIGDDYGNDRAAAAERNGFRRQESPITVAEKHAQALIAQVTNNEIDLFVPVEIANRHAERRLTGINLYRR